MPSFVYVTSIHTQGTNTLTFTAASTAGDVIVAANAEFGGTLATSVTDNLGNTYTKLGVHPTGNVTVFVATNVGAGTATLTFSGASGANTSYIAADYNAPTSYHYFSNWVQEIFGISTWIYNYDIQSYGTAGTVTEFLLVPICYETSGSDGWAISSGNIREHTAEGGGESLVLADTDFTLPGTCITTLTDTTAGRNFFLGAVGLIGYSGGGGGGGGVILGDMSAGMRG